MLALQNNTRQQQELRRHLPRKLTHYKEQGLWHGCLLNCLLIATIDTLCSRASERTVILSNYSQSDSVRDFVAYCLFVMLINPQPESRGLRILQNLRKLRKIASWTILRQCVAKFMNFCTFLWCYKLTHNPRDAACGVFQTCENWEKIASLTKVTNYCLLIATIDALFSKTSKRRLCQ